MYNIFRIIFSYCFLNIAKRSVNTSSLPPVFLDIIQNSCSCQSTSWAHYSSPWKKKNQNKTYKNWLYEPELCIYYMYLLGAKYLTKAVATSIKLIIWHSYGQDTMLLNVYLLAFQFAVLDGVTRNMLTLYSETSIIRSLLRLKKIGLNCRVVSLSIWNIEQN